VSASGFQLVAHTREELEEKALAVCADSNDPLGDQEIAERAGLTLPEALPVIQKLHADGTLPCARGCSFCSEPEEGAP
jgi:hypothetical protein